MKMRAEGQLLLVWDERKGPDRWRCRSCMRRRYCWGDGFYDETYFDCLFGDTDLWVSDEVLQARDEKAGGRP